MGEYLARCGRADEFLRFGGKVADGAQILGAARQFVGARHLFRHAVSPNPASASASRMWRIRMWRQWLVAREECRSQSAARKARETSRRRFLIITP